MREIATVAAEDMIPDRERLAEIGKQVLPPIRACTPGAPV